VRVADDEPRSVQLLQAPSPPGVLAHGNHAQATGPEGAVGVGAAHGRRGEPPALRAEARLVAAQVRPPGHRHGMVAECDEAAREAGLEERELAAPVLGHAELRAEEEQLRLGRLAERRRERHEVRDPAPVDPEAARPQRRKARGIERPFVMDQHRQVRGDGAEAGHGAARLVKGVIEDADPAAAEGCEDPGRGLPEHLRMLAGDDEPSLLVRRRGRGGFEQPVDPRRKHRKELEAVAAHRAQGAHVLAVPVAVEPGHPHEAGVGRVRDPRPEVEPRKGLQERGAVLEPSRPRAEVDHPHPPRAWRGRGSCPPHRGGRKGGEAHVDKGKRSTALRLHPLPTARPGKT